MFGVVVGIGVIFFVIIFVISLRYMKYKKNVI